MSLRTRPITYKLALGRSQPTRISPLLSAQYANKASPPSTSQTVSYATTRAPFKPKRPVSKVPKDASKSTGDPSVLNYEASSVDLEGIREFQKLDVAPFPLTPAETLRNTWVVFCNTVNGRARQDAIHHLPLTAFPQISAQQLHELAVTLSYMPKTNTSDFPWAIMWAVASRANYEPATLSFALFLAMSDRGQGFHKMPWLQARFEKSLTDGNPNAAAIGAKFAFNRGQVQEATSILESLLSTSFSATAATTSGSDTDHTALEIKDLAASWLARCYFTLGQNNKALQAVAGRRPTPEVQQQVAKLLYDKGDLVQARKQLFGSWGSGDLSVLQKLSAIDAKWAEEAKDESSRKEYWRWAAEWNAMEKTMASYLSKHVKPAKAT